jgi:DNA-binding LacI/PurR family transcriptional regulator
MLRGIMMVPRIMAARSTPPAGPVRLIDVARAAGVSRTTVASILLQSAGDNVRVAPDTAERIRAIAAKLGYRANIAAQRLAGKRPHLVGVIIDSQAPMSAYRQLAELERCADRHGHRLMVGQSHDDLARIQACAADFAAHGIAAVACISHDYPSMGRQVAATFRRFPHAVFLGRPLSGARESLWVAADHADATRRLVDHLVAQGRKRIALWIARDDYQSTQARRDGYRAAMAAHGLPAREDEAVNWDLDVWHWNRPQAAVDLTDRLTPLLKPQAPDAIIAQNDLMAQRLVRALRRLGRRVPDDIAIVGHENQPLGDSTDPALTTIDLMDQEVARRAMDLLLAALDGQAIPAGQRQQWVAPTLVVRESG